MAKQASAFPFILKAHVKRQYAEAWPCGCGHALQYGRCIVSAACNEEPASETGYVKQTES